MQKKKKPRRHYDLTAIIYDKRGRILSIGKNSYVKTHPKQAHHAKRVGKEKGIFLHAEMDAIIKCRDISKAYKMSIFRYSKDGKPLPACPCPICNDGIKTTPIKVIEYTQ